MKRLALPLGLLLALIPTGGLRAQVNLVPAADGTGTIVTPVGDRLDIEGGTTSSDGANLFHSFSQFDLNANQIANFLSTPELRNILGRVVGGDASLIDGLIQVTGGAPNLYLLNPSGVIFGPNARLNVPGDFTVSTATRIGFGNDTFFDVFGNSEYADLIGDPQTFSFVAGESGAILNAGELAVDTDRNLLLLGSTVINTGRLQTAGGEVILEAVAGTQNVRLSLPGHILSLEVPAEAIATGIQAEELPVLLAGGDLPPTGLEVAADGSVTLNATGNVIPTSPGSTVVGGNIDATGATGGRVQILGDRVGLFQAEIDASGLVGDGGTVLVGGDFQGQGPTPIAAATYVSPGSAIAVDGGPTGNGGLSVVFSETATAFAGEASARGGALAGNGGTVEVSSQGDLGVTGRLDASAPNGTAGRILFDPATISIVSIDADTASDDLELADGEILFDDVIIGAEGGIDADFVITDAAILDALDSSGTVVLQATASIDFNTDLIAEAPPAGELEASLSLEAPDINLNGAAISLAETDINITATTGSINGGVEIPASITTNGGAGISLSAGGSITNVSASTSTPLGNAGNIEIEAAGEIDLSGEIAANSFAGGNGGPVTIESTGGNVTIGTSADDNSIDTSAVAGDGGAVDLDSAGTLGIAANINTSSSGGVPGEIAVDATGDITVGGGIFAIANSPENGGDVSVNRINETPGTIAFGGPIVTLSVDGNGGAIAVTNTAGDVEIGALSSRSINGVGGNVTVDASQGFLRLLGTNDAIPGDGEEASLIPASSALSVGGTGDGTITLIHGGDGETPFIVGDAATNGSAGDLIGGDVTSTIAEGSFLVDEIVGNVSILTDDGDEGAPPPVVPPVLPPPTPIETPTLSGDINVTLARDVLTAAAFVEEGVEDTRSAKPGVGGRTLSEPSKIITLSDAKLTLTAIERATGVRPALIYVNFVPLTAASPVATAEELDLTRQETVLTRSYEEYYSLPDPKSGLALSVPPEPTDRLELLLVTPEGEPTRVVVSEAQRKEVLNLAQRFYAQTSNPTSRNYLPLAQQLYDVMIRPLAADLEAAEVENLVFLLPEGLRLLPVAALHDGDRFLVESFSTGLAPSLSLTDTNYRSIQDLKVFAAGATDFSDENALGPLPAVSVEVPAIATQVWNGEFILDEAFTVEGFKAQRRNSPTGIVHLATHADFKLNTPSENYIQFFDRRLRLDEVRELGLNAPAVELMVLSACRTAFGDRDIELGFGGLAVQAGVKSAMASLWYVGDTGTLALMTEFYTQLDSAPIKADALRAAQVALLEKEVVVRDGEIEGSTSTFPLPGEALSEQEEDLSHPFYWATFTMVGSPW